MKGYEQMGFLITKCPELLILRRFDRLSARVLLRLQAELLYLEQELDLLIEEDEKDDIEFSTYHGKVREVQFEDRSATHLDKFSDVEIKLKEYHETILRLQAIRNINSPTARNRERLWTWLQSREGGNNFLRSIEAGPWKSEPLEEMLGLTPQNDRLDEWLSDVVTPLYHQLFGHKRKPDLGHEFGCGRLWLYQMTWLHYLGDIICVLLSSVVPVVSIQGLYWIPTTLGRLSLITGLIIIFSVLLMFVAGCRRSEVFAATSAFAAVLVVFLQGLDGAVNYTAAANPTP